MRHKVVALLLAGLFVVSAASTAWAHCGGWSPSVADRHACCRTGAMASESRVTACCAMSEQSDDQGPLEGRFAAVPLQMVRHISASFATVTLPAAVVAPRAAVFLLRPSSVPLYLRQVSLLI